MVLLANLLTERIQKVILHEIGHNHGLNHCTSPGQCFMKAANRKISEVDNEPMEMCRLCRQKANP
jgi:archaemetzincin